MPKLELHQGNQGTTKPMAKVWRQRISDSNLLTRLIGFAENDRKFKMTATQAKVALALIDKVLPSLQAVNFTGELDLNVVRSEPVSASDWLRKHGEESVLDGGDVPLPKPSRHAQLPQAALIGWDVGDRIASKAKAVTGLAPASG